MTARRRVPVLLFASGAALAAALAVYAGWAPDGAPGPLAPEPPRIVEAPPEAPAEPLPTLRARAHTHGGLTHRHAPVRPGVWRTVRVLARPPAPEPAPEAPTPPGAPEASGGVHAHADARGGAAPLTEPGAPVPPPDLRRPARPLSVPAPGVASAPEAPAAGGVAPASAHVPVETPPPRTRG